MLDTTTLDQGNILKNKQIKTSALMYDLYLYFNVQLSYYKRAITETSNCFDGIYQCKTDKRILHINVVTKLLHNMPVFYGATVPPVSDFG